MTHDIVMPQLGMTMTEGSVMRWLKAAGDPIEKGEPLFLVQTDKVDMEVESPGSGFVTELLVQEEVIVPVGTVIARVGATPEPEPTVEIAARRNGPLVSPRARRVALELGIDLSQVKGTGEFGRIREADVRALERPKVEGPPKVEDRSGAAARKKIAERMEESVRTIPHFTLRREVDASQLVALREQLLAAVQARVGVRLSFTDFLLKAMALALREAPQLNAQTAINVAFAAQSPSRLLTPVVAGADLLSIAEIARRRSELAAKVKDGKVTPSDLEGASCSLSNLGAFGVDEFDAIINPPERCILAAGRIASRPFVREGQLIACPTLRLTLTVDHRVADGVLGSVFLNAIATGIEQPALLLI